MNTAVNFVYRDAENNKYYGGHVFAGEVTLEQAERIQKTLYDGVFFIAEQVGIEPVYPWLCGESSGYYHDIDHPYMTLHIFPFGEERPKTEEEFRSLVESGSSDLRFTAIAEPTDGRTIEEFVQSMERAHAEGWKHSILVDQWGAH